jgi:hypothetical protein
MDIRFFLYPGIIPLSPEKATERLRHAMTDSVCLLVIPGVDFPPGTEDMPITASSIRICPCPIMSIRRVDFLFFGG